MKISKFYGNEADDLHCMQASFRMVFEALSQENISLERSEELTGFVHGQQTWPFEAMLSFANAGFKVTNIENVDNALFAKDAEAAMVSQYGQKVWEHIQKSSDVERAQEKAALCLVNSNIEFQKRVPNIDDIRNLIYEKNFLICNVNYFALLGINKYNGHFVVVEDIDNTSETICIQNPGLPPISNQIVSIDMFKSAWYSPDENAGNIIAIRR